MKPDSLRKDPLPIARIVAGVLAGLLAVAIFMMSSVQSSGLPRYPEGLDKVAHFSEYALLAALIAVAANAPRRKLWLAGLIAIVLASLYGVSDEVHQYFVPTRTTDFFDWLADTLGATCGAIAVIWSIAARKVKDSRQNDRLL